MHDPPAACRRVLLYIYVVFFMCGVFRISHFPFLRTFPTALLNALLCLQTLFPRYADCDAISHWGSTRRLVVKLKCLTVRHSVLTFTFLSWLVGEGHQECTTVECLLARLALLYGTSVEQLTSTYINWPINYSSRPGQGYLRSLDIADLLSHTDSMYVKFV